MRLSPRFTAWMATSPCRTNSEEGASLPVASFTLTMVSLVSVLGIGTPCADLVGLPSQTGEAQWACPRNPTEEIVEPGRSLALPREANRSRTRGHAARRPGSGPCAHSTAPSLIG